ncbi:serine hydrolase domain-containing protein [Paramicrobacterium chengjingii]|uniref:serine hydrolase domain-containing protein n=1 Tax=Paramicrobacterium chengjingii TaxID=2769067 RepID=UPI00142334D5|nr:serine hydrolase domain-containing protein [Microbacterium chengjingii]
MPIPTRPSIRARRPHRTLGTIVAAAAVVALLAGCAAPAATTAAPQLPAPPAPPADGSTARTLTQTDVDAWLDGILPSALDRADIAGATVSVVSNGELLTARGYGYADTGAEKLVDPAETLFRVGSISKVFTATAVMQLVESGDLDLDVDVSEYLDFTIPRQFDEPITLRTLLTHTAGFEERIGGLIRFDGTKADLRDSLATDPPEQVYRPGTTPAYSNYGNGVAGYIVQNVSGERFEDYIDAHILTPLGMSSSTFAQPLPDDLSERMSRGYATTDSPATPFETVSTSPPGALSATATDMAKFMLAQLGEIDPDHALLAPQTLALMHQPALSSDTLGTLANGPRMTLGFFDESRNGQSILGHGGDTTVFHSHMQLYPDAGVGIFLSVNSSGASPLDSSELRSAVTDGFADRYFPSTGTNRDAVVEPTAQDHAALAEGRYMTSRGFESSYMAATGIAGQMTVTAPGDGTVILNPAPLGITPATYEEVGPWLWQEVGGTNLISMRVENGHVQAIGFESAFSMLRVDAAHNAGLVVPILVISVLILLLSLLFWPIIALVRRHYRVAAPANPSRLFRISRIVTFIGSAVALVALASWLVIIQAVSGFESVPATLIRGIQVLQVIGVLAIVPATLTLTLSIRHHLGWRRIAGGALMCAALVGIAWFAFVFKLIAPSISA